MVFEDFLRVVQVGIKNLIFVEIYWLTLNLGLAVWIKAGFERDLIFLFFY